MRSFRGIIFAAVIAAVGVMGTGCSDDNVVGNVFHDIDTNADKLVSSAEWGATFGRWDVNHDGVISRSEYLLDRGFDQLDVDGNGLLTDAEWNAAMVDWDVDGDGVLDEQEMLA